jgi:malonyl CoA-acyl carrier protein transacylase
LSNLSRNITKEEIEFEEKIDWDKVLTRDPFSCALSLVCQLAAGAEKANQDANAIHELIT